MVLEFEDVMWLKIRGKKRIFNLMIKSVFEHQISRCLSIVPVDDAATPWDINCTEIGLHRRRSQGATVNTPAWSIVAMELKLVLNSIPVGEQSCGRPLQDNVYAVGELNLPPTWGDNPALADIGL